MATASYDIVQGFGMDPSGSMERGVPVGGVLLGSSGDLVGITGRRGVKLSSGWGRRPPVVLNEN